MAGRDGAVWDGDGFASAPGTFPRSRGWGAPGKAQPLPYACRSCFLAGAEAGRESCECPAHLHTSPQSPTGTR